MDEPTIASLPLDGMGPEPCLLFLPASGSGPGLLLLHDIFGVDDRIRDLARNYAEEGYLVAVPDLYWLRGIEAAEATGERLEWESWFFQDDELEASTEGPDIPRLALEPALDDVVHTLAALRAHEACTGKLAVAGYGLGGTLAVFAAARLDVDASVAFDAGGLDRAVPELRARCAPLVVHAAGADEPGAGEQVARFREALVDWPGTRAFVYEGEPCDFALDGPRLGEAAILLAHSRTIAHLRRFIGPVFDLERVWDAHLKALLGARDPAAVLGSLARDPYVNCVPTMAGGRGLAELRSFYSEHLLPGLPADLHATPVSRAIGADRIVEELVLEFTHDRVMDFLLPDVAPTFRRVEVPLVVIATFKGDRIWRVHFYWDQASALAQVGRIDARSLPVSGIEEAHRVLLAS